MHDGNQVFCLHTRTGSLRISVGNFIRRKHDFRICPVISVFRSHQKSLGRRNMLIRRICQILIIELPIPIGQHRLVIISPSSTIRRIRMFTIGTYQLNIMHSHYRRQLSIMIGGIRKFGSSVMYPVLC